MKQTAKPTDQRAKVRPISFVLNRGYQFDDVTLNIRPEDLTRNEPSRVSVHQTLGRDVSGWVDDFGEGLGSVTIAGHTGWGAGGLADGAVAFESLNRLIVHDYHAARQNAIDYGIDPATVKLIFVDLLDNFAWCVTPTNFVLRRSKSRPLFFQYNISLQAVSLNAELNGKLLPFVANKAAGLKALAKSISRIESLLKTIKGITDTVKKFVALSKAIFNFVSGVVSGIIDVAKSIKSTLVDLATSIAQIGANIFKTISAIANLPAALKAELMQVGAAFNEAKCILKNSLRPAKFYDDYSGLYGASNCSSTTGGNPASAYADKNSFDLMKPASTPVSVSSAASASMSALSKMDPVLAPMPPAEMDRHLSVVNSGVSI